MTIDDLLHFVFTASRALHPSEMPEELHIVMVGGRIVRYSLLAATVAPPTSPLPQPSATSEEQDEGRRGLPRCVLDILNTLREFGRPLTTTRLLEEMYKRNRDWGDRTVQIYLKRLMDDGTLINPPDARPRGYRLPESDAEQRQEPGEGRPAK